MKIKHGITTFKTSMDYPLVINIHIFVDIVIIFKSISEYNSDLYSDKLKKMIYENHAPYKI